jgi:hypothetical protein
MDRERASVSATVVDGAGVSARGNVAVRATAQSLSTTSTGVSSVQVLEGGSAFIATGSSVPIVTSVAAGVGRRTWAGTSTSYRELTRGFVVTPRVNGELVVLDIEQRDEGVQGGQIATQRLATQVSVQLGAWTELGGVSESASAQSRGIANRTQQTRSDERSIWVKVDAR